ncbi:hypothetical protein KAX02_07485 [candidate division WOR-3 bacterium]|nr:hypothetical protein [candidate division WOR-3 bacterium]
MRLKILGIHDGHNASATLLEDGWTVLVGSDIEKIVKAIKGFEAKGMQRNVFGDGKASERICKILESYPENFKIIKKNPEYQERFK